MFKNLQNLLLSINISYNDDLKNQIIESIQHLNQVASDLEYMNNVFVNREKRLVLPPRTKTSFIAHRIVNEDDPEQSVPCNRFFTTVFLKYFGITQEQLPPFIIPGFNSEELKK